MGITIPQRGVIVPKIAPISGRRYSTRSSFGGTASTLALTANILYGSPFYVPSAAAANLLSLNVTVAAAAGKLLRLGLYSALVTSGLPDALLYDSGSLAADTGAPFVADSPAISPTIALVPGLLYWLAVVSDGTPTVTTTAFSGQITGAGSASEGNHSGTFRSHTFGALPSTWGAHTAANISTSIPHIVARVA